ncbi:MAG: serine--tRNA ligase [Pseudomonadota bacterium]
MHDINVILDNPAAFNKLMESRKVINESGNGDIAEQAIKLVTDKKNLVTKIQQLQAERKQIAAEINQLFKAGKKELASEKQSHAKELNQQIKNLEESDIHDKLTEFLSHLPNILADDVPIGLDETANKEIRKIGDIKSFDFTPKQHFELGENLGLIDFTQTAKISGSRFVTLSGNLAKMERALAAFMLDIAVNEFQYTELSPPLMVKDNAMYGVGQLPKFELDSFKTTDDYRLIPTAEVPLTNMVADKILSENELPLRYTAFTPCFRSEAGSAGKDTRGMIRLHQFSKVELVSITTQEKSSDEHERLTSIAEKILTSLELPYRIVVLCSGDTGFSAFKTYDIEVWLPGQNCYREISSCSNFIDFQARRMKARYKNQQGKNVFVHTLNGSALAIGRTIVAILENYQNMDGSINIPTKLQPYMNGLTKLTK